MLKIYVEIIGTKSLLFHKFNLDAITAITKAKSGNKGNDSEEWKNSFFEKKNKIYIPSSYLLAAFRNGAINTKLGRGSIQKTWVSAANIEEEIVFSNRSIWDNWQESTIENVPKESTSPVYIDIRAINNPNTKGKNIRYRVALSPGWEFKFTLLIDDNLISLAHAKKVIEDTGKLQGLCDGRTLGYGRFDVLNIQTEKSKKEK